MRALAAFVVVVSVSGGRVAGAGAATVEGPFPVRVHTTVRADSVTVGERFAVDVEFAYPDSLRALAPGPLREGNCRVLDFHYGRSHGEVARKGWSSRTAKITAMTTDLKAARLPAVHARFVTPRGDTVVASGDDVEIPVRSLVAAGDSLAPLKSQWVAPRGVPAWVEAALALVLAGLLVLWWWRRRRRAPVEEPAVPALPADYRALTELSRIEREGILERGQYKTYYSRVTGVVRQYIGERFAVEAMESTSDELVDALGRKGLSVEELPPMLAEADLVKFARYVPDTKDGEQLMRTARQIVTRTAPRAVSDPVPESGAESGTTNQDAPARHTDRPAAEPAGGGGAGEGGG